MTLKQQKPKWLQLPQSRVGRLAVLFNLLAILSGILVTIIPFLLVPFMTEKIVIIRIIIGLINFAAIFIFGIIGAILSIRSIKKRERSIFLIIPLILGVLTVAFWVMMLVGEVVFPH